jgi:hypothetical protein
MTYRIVSSLKLPQTWRYIDYRLCYISGGQAYFTTKDPTDQWGDDWDDAPYEHNAGMPYMYDEHNQRGGEAPWDIVVVSFSSDLEPPDRHHWNSPYSVESINKGAVAWLAPPVHDFDRVAGRVYEPIYGGAGLVEFARKIRQSGGDILIPSLMLVGAHLGHMPNWVLSMLPSQDEYRSLPDSVQDSSVQKAW